MEDKDKIKQKIDIVDLISSYIPLKKTGRNFKANCPFHNEKSPSFVVSSERQIWHCFGCQKGGDIFTFVMEHECMDFSESLEYLASRAGITLTKRVIKSDIQRQKDLLYEINNLASQFYSFLLREHTIGKGALEYLTSTRKLPLELIKRFQLGYAPSNPSALFDFLIKKKHYTPSDLLASGLIVQKRGQLSDFFTHRIIFPLFDSRENIIAFSGRILTKDSFGPKYINNRETLIYKKGDTLYGLYQAKEGIKNEEKAILVEGEFDVLSSFREGINNVAAVKGTALTENQIKLLKRYAQKIVFSFDQDQAGINAQRRSIEMIEKEGLVASVILPPHGKDLDELANEDPILFKKTIKHDIPMYDFIIDSFITQYNPSEIENKRVIVEKVLPFLVGIENEVVKEHYYKKLASRLDTSVESLHKQANKLSKPSQRIPETTIISSKKALSRQELLERYFILLLTQAQNPTAALRVAETSLSNNSLSHPLYKRLYQLMHEYFSTYQASTIIEFARTLPSELLPSFDELYLSSSSAFEDEKHYSQELEKITKEIRQLAIKSKLKSISASIKKFEQDHLEDEANKLKEEFNTLALQLQK